MVSPLEGSYGTNYSETWRGKESYMRPTFPVCLVSLSNQIVDKGKSLFKGVLQPINKEGTTELEYYQFATPNGIRNLGNNRQGLRKPFQRQPKGEPLREPGTKCSGRFMVL